MFQGDFLYPRFYLYKILLAELKRFQVIEWKGKLAVRFCQENINLEAWNECLMLAGNASNPSKT